MPITVIANTERNTISILPVGDNNLNVTTPSPTIVEVDYNSISAIFAAIEPLRVWIQQNNSKVENTPE